MTKAEQALVAHMIDFVYMLQTYQINYAGSDENANRVRREMEDKHRELTDAVLLERLNPEVYDLVLAKFCEHQRVRIASRGTAIEERMRVNDIARVAWNEAQEEVERLFGREQLDAAKVALWARGEYPKPSPRAEATA